MTERYDRIGVGYSSVRREDPRIATRIADALAGARRVVNVGAGAGSYEPPGRIVAAVEPSTVMLAQRPAGSAPAVRAVAGAMPFPDAAFDGALALLTVHHWPDPDAGLRELRRVTAGPVVVFTFDLAVHTRMWLVSEYFPGIAVLDEGAPTPEAIAAGLGGGEVRSLPVPWDCADGFCHAYWRRPEAYLRPEVQAGISGLARIPKADLREGTERLASDLTSGRWHERHRDLLDERELDTGYRLVVSPGVTPG